MSDNAVIIEVIDFTERKGAPAVLVFPRYINAALADWANSCPEPLMFWFRGEKTWLEGPLEFGAPNTGQDK